MGRSNVETHGSCAVREVTIIRFDGRCIYITSPVYAPNSEALNAQKG
jgi:hypothetical protein